jgi:hypothetical protein
MLKSKVTNIKSRRAGHHNAASLKEIKALAALEYRQNKKTAQHEPADLYSGDMKKIIRGDDDHEE